MGVDEGRHSGAIAVKWELTIPDWVPDSRLSLNGRRRGNWLQTRQLQMDAKTVVHLALNSMTPWPATVDPANVAVTFVYPNHRRRDPDGLAGLAKPILDVLVDRGLLVDDDCEHISLTVAAEVEKGASATRITVTAPRGRG